MKRTVKKERLIGKFISIPPRESGVFKLPAPAFKLYVWLCSHENGYEFTDYYLRNGIKIDDRSIEIYLKILQDSGWITISQRTINLSSISSQSPISSSPTTTNSQSTTTNSQPTINSGQSPTKIVVGELTKNIIEDKEENKEKDNIKDNVINSIVSETQKNSGFDLNFNDDFQDLPFK